MRNHNLAIRAEPPAELDNVARLVHVVEFLAQSLLEFLVHRARVDLLAHHVMAERLQRPQQQLEILQILLDGILDARILNLHRDIDAVARDRTMHLAERRGGKRGLIEAPEDCLGPLANLLANLFRNSRVAHRRHARLRRAQHVERLARQQVLANREHLDELHERAAKLLGAFDDSLRVADMSLEQFALARGRAQKRPPQLIPQVAGADLRRELAHLDRAARASAGD